MLLITSIERLPLVTLFEEALEGDIELPSRCGVRCQSALI